MSISSIILILTLTTHTWLSWHLPGLPVLIYTLFPFAIKYRLQRYFKTMYSVSSYWFLASLHDSFMNEILL